MLVVTHNGNYHLDDVMACAILKDCFDDVQVVRSRDPDVWATADIVFDVGGGKFDHHFNGAEKRPSGITYSSCGLIWREYGRQFLSRQPNVWVKIVEPMVYPPLVEDMWREWDRIIEQVDAHDNGEAESDNGDLSFAAFVGAFNGSKPFIEVVQYMLDYMRARTVHMLQYHNDAVIVRKALAKRDVPFIVELPRDMTWQTVLAAEAPEVDFVVYKNHGAWRVTSVPVAPGKFESKIPLPVRLRGLEKDALQKESGLPLTFIHKSGFTGGAETHSAALALIGMALFEFHENRRKENEE